MTAPQTLFRDACKILLAIKDAYPRIVTGTATQSEINNFVAQGSVAADKTQELMNALGRQDDAGKVVALTQFYDEIANLLRHDLKDAKPLCRDLVRQFTEIATFHVVHEEGDQSAWRALADRYRRMLATLPKE
ncbi:hypothetical protein [Afifella marina]|uniref:Uncharacterized protein n=1 Tax=Afifella marina DSM 2698 TaxID=1120955 RepID=A0A1G5N260_AFIMA|nr:hypothetical protein [Afifella marina]MBK1622255.1 hypothetical protein [Afifella marina DSM 2698]MBK1628380.1 hypothetical protein [Afifella marina]MBK5919039.1 hypothetical protein [Afifella marina]RAI20222.1 hypothetical protein CH311_10375 [Afifella marina DSM 2698]SCZ30760.1 hypothetical protein SAMN03080610_01291 [Afifella marina DSM 2698]